MKKLLLLLVLLAVAIPSQRALAIGLAADDLPRPPTAAELLGIADEPTPALPGIGSDETTQTVTEGAKPDDVPFFVPGATLIYENSVGIGSFVPDDAQRRAQWDMLWSIRAKAYLFHKFLLAQLRLDMFQPILQNADSSTTKERQFTISDTILTFLAPVVYQEPVTEIRFGAFTEFLFPSSLASQHVGRYLNWRFGFMVGRSFGPVDIQYQFRFSKSFNARPNPQLDYEFIPTVEKYPAAGITTEFDIMNRLTVSVAFLEDFYAALDFAIINAWTYDTGDSISCAEAGLPDGCDLHADFARPGRGQTDLTSMVIEFGWQPLKYLTVALGIMTYQPPIKSDNSGFRFPLNFSDASANYTTIYLDVIGTY